MDDDVGAEPRRRNDHRREGIVDDHRDVLIVRYPAQLGDVSDGERRIGDGLKVEHVGPAANDRRRHRVVVADVDERRRDVARAGEEVGEERVGPAVEGAGGDHVAAGAAELEEDGGDGGHAGGGAVGGLRALEGGHEAAEVEHGGVEVAAVDEEVAVGAELAGEHPPHRLRLHHREGGGGLDRHVDAAVLAELVAGIGQRRRRVLGVRRLGRGVVLLGGGELVPLVVGGARALLGGDVWHGGIEGGHLIQCLFWEK